MLKLRFHKHFNYVGVDISIYALLPGGRISYPLDWFVLYPRSVLLCGLVVVVLCIGLPTTRSCAAWNDNNKDDVCTRTIPAGLKRPPPSKTISPIPRLEAYLNTLRERIPRRPSERFSVFKPGTLRQCRFYIRRSKAEEFILPQESKKFGLPTRSEASPAKGELD